MKYLLVLVVLAVAWMVWRAGRRDRQDAVPPPAPAPSPAQRGQALAKPVPMLACAHCGTHVPEHEAVRGHKGVYCGRAHLLVAEPEHGA